MYKLTTKKVIVASMLVLVSSMVITFNGEDSVNETNYPSEELSENAPSASGSYISEDSKSLTEEAAETTQELQLSGSNNSAEVHSIQSAEDLASSEGSVFEEYTIAYADDIGLELTFFDDSEEIDSEGKIEEHETMLADQLLAYEAEVNELKLDAIESLDSELKKQAIEKLINYDGEQATRVLVDVVFDINNEHRITAVEGLIKKLDLEGIDQQLVLDTMRVLALDGDSEVASIAYHAINKVDELSENK